MKTKWVFFAFFVVGNFLTLFGALFKLQSWPIAGEMLTIGTICNFIGMSGLIYLWVKKL